MSLCSVIIPTWNNLDFLYPCVQSILTYTMPEDLVHIYIVNNGKPADMEPFKNNPYITILQQEKNMGWEGGLKAGLAASKEPYVVFMNDDTYVPSHQRMWLYNMLQHFGYPDCAAVGPTSNVVMGRQNSAYLLWESGYQVKFLIGFCMLLRRDYLEQAGGVDDTAPGGDDLDLSIRLRKLGKYLICDRETFIYHHGFKTGVRLKGAEWNSADMRENTNNFLIQKHGLEAFMDLWKEAVTPTIEWDSLDKEGELVRKHVPGGRVLELGCGDKKTIPGAVGVDMIPKGLVIPGLEPNRTSVADLTADVQDKIPVENGTFDVCVARHVLEHMVNPFEAVRNWGETLRHGGRLIVAVPDHRIRNTIPLNHQHVHAFTPDSLKDMMETMGWKTEAIEDANNYVSFVGVFTKNGLH